MQNQKSRKSLIVGIVAAVVILAALLAVLLTQCDGLFGGTTEPVETSDPNAALTYELYWNLDRELYDGKSEAGMSSRETEEDGLYHIRFVLDGKEVTLRSAERKVVNKIDTMDLMGLTFDEDGLIVDALDPEDMPLELVGYMFFVQSVGGKVIKLNSSENFTGMEVLLDREENTGIWDMSGVSGPVGTETDPIIYDRVIAVRNLDGELTHVFIVDRSNYFLTHEAECQHCEQTVTWYEWTKDDELPNRTGHYQLMNDIQLEAQHSLAADAKLCLDLNGYTVNGADNARVFSLHYLGTEFALMDTSEAGTGKLAGHSTSSPQGGVVWVRHGNFYMYGGTLDGTDVIGTNGAVVMVDAKRFFYLYDGTILGATARAQALATTSTGWGYGAGGSVYVRGTMRMYGGTIQGGRATEGYYYKNGKKTAARGIGGNIFLNTGSVMEIQGGKILNGYAGNAGGNIYADGTAELTISGGVIAGGSSNSKTTSGHGGNIYTGGKTVVTMTGGSIYGGRSAKECGGGNVGINGTFNMYGGTIYGGKATVGGNVHLGNNARFTMYGGLIRDGIAEKNGGNVNVSGKSIMYMRGGRIQNGVAPLNGGNVVCNVTGTFNMYGGIITGGVAKGTAAGNGGGNIAMVANGVAANIYGGTITGGSAEGVVNEDGSTTGGDGGNINMNRGTLTISGGTITGGKVTGNAGGVYVGSNSVSLTLSGNALIYGNGTDIMRSSATAEGKSQIIVDGWKGNGDEDQLVIDRLKGEAGSVIALPVEGKVLTEADLALFVSARKVLPLAINSAGQLAFAEQVTMGEADHIHCLCNGTYKGHTCADTGFVSVDAAGFKACFVAKSSGNNLLGDMNLCLTEDIELDTAHFTAGYKLNLCLNGHTITVKDDGRLTPNGNTGVLNITDCTGKGVVKADESRKASLLTTYNGELNIYGGTFDASAIKLGTKDSKKVGPAVYMYMDNDRFAMYGGKIIGGEAYRGGTVYVYRGAFEMYGGEITGGTAALGGNVAVNYGSFHMYGGEITGGTALTNGAGVHIGANASVKTLTLAGNAKIYGNGTEDVYLGYSVASRNYLILDGWNGNGGKALILNCRSAGMDSVVAKAKTGQLTEDVLTHLNYFDGQLLLKLKDGAVVLGTDSDHEHCLCNGALDHSCNAIGFAPVATVEEFKALFDSKGILTASTNIVLTGDFTLDSAYFAKGNVLNLCLNGHTLTMTEKARLTPSSKGELNITDCDGKGVIKATDACEGTFVRTYTASTVNFYAGTLDASAIENDSRNGGAVSMISKDDAFNMYGGKIIGAKLVNRGGAVYVSATAEFNMHGGEITGGNAAVGGAVCMLKGTMNMTGGTITGCTAAGTDAAGGGVSILEDATGFTLSGTAKIYGNTVNGKAQDVYMGKENLSLILDNWSGNGENGALVLSCKSAVAGSTVAVAKEGQLTADDLNKLKYADSAFTLELKEGKAVLAAVPTAHEHCLCNDGTLANGCTNHEKYIFTEVSDAAAFAALIENGTSPVNICLSGSFTLEDTCYIKGGKTVNLCLGNEILTVTGDVQVQKDSTLNITACGAKGKIQAGTDADMVLYANNGAINLYRGTLDFTAVNGSTSGYTPIKLDDGENKTDYLSTFTMYGGDIIGATMAYRGGAIYASYGNVYMYGGTITGGTATLGGAVSINKGVMVMSGGTISGCAATGTSATGGGVNIQANATSFTLSGDAKIYGNTVNDEAQDVYMGKTNLSLVLDDWNGNGSNAKLVLSCKGAVENSTVATAPAGKTLTDADAAKLSYDSDELGVVQKDGVLILSQSHVHCACGGSMDGHGHVNVTYSTKVSSADEFKALFDSDGKLKANTDVVLTGSFELNSQYFTSGYTLNLCLNGNTVTLKESGRMTADGETGTLVITTCKDGGKITAAEGCADDFLYTDGGHINMYGGEVKAQGQRPVSLNGTDSTFNLYGGTITGGTEAFGGNILVNTGTTLTMYGGNVLGGTSTRTAGDKGGGNIHVENGGTFDMQGGTVSGGHCDDRFGGNVCVLGYMKMTGGTITKGSAKYGGNVALSHATNQTGKLDMSGGQITEGTCVTSGDGVYARSNSGALTLSADAKIYGNGTVDVYLDKKDKCLVLDGWNGNGTNDALVLGCKEAAENSIVAKAPDGKTLVEADVAKLVYNSEDLAVKLSDEGNIILYTLHRHCLCVDGKLASGCTMDHSKLTFTPVASFDELKAAVAEQSPVNIYLTASFELTEDISVSGKVVNLCLNDQILTVTTARLLVGADGTLNITACNEAGKITSSYSQTIQVNGGNAALYNGTVNVSGVSGKINGGAVYVNANDSTFTMYGGTIIGTKSSTRGGAVYVNKGRFNMHGGLITDGYSTGGGGGVCVNTGHMEMTGGTITNCTDGTTKTPRLGGGVCILGSADSFTLSGTAKIYGNKSNGGTVDNDVYIGNKDKTAFYMILDQWEGNGKDENENSRVLYISFHNNKTAGGVVAQAETGKLTTDDVGKFACTGGTFALELNADGKVVLKAK